MSVSPVVSSSTTKSVNVPPTSMPARMPEAFDIPGTQVYGIQYTMENNNPLIASPVRDLPKRVAIIGAGTIGPDIGYYLKSALPALELTPLAVARAAPARALERFSSYASKAVARGKMSEADAAAVT